MDNSLVIQILVRDVLEAQSPDELDLVGGYKPSDNKDGETARGSQGIGVTTGIALLLPIIYRFFDKFLDRLASRLADGTIDIMRDWLTHPDKKNDDEMRDYIRSGLHEAGLSDEQLSSVTETVLETIKRKHTLIGV